MHTEVGVKSILQKGKPLYLFGNLNALLILVFLNQMFFLGDSRANHIVVNERIYLFSEFTEIPGLRKRYQPPPLDKETLHRSLLCDCESTRLDLGPVYTMPDKFLSVQVFVRITYVYTNICSHCLSVYTVPD